MLTIDTLLKENRSQWPPPSQWLTSGNKAASHSHLTASCFEVGVEPGWLAIISSQVGLLTFGSLIFGILSFNWHLCAAWDRVVVWSVACSCVILLVCLEAQSLLV